MTRKALVEGQNKRVDRSFNILTVAQQILQEYNRPMHYREIARIAVRREMLPASCKDPAETIRRHLAIACRTKRTLSGGGQFIRVSRGVYELSNPSKPKPHDKSLAKRYRPFLQKHFGRWVQVAELAGGVAGVVSCLISLLGGQSFQTVAVTSPEETIDATEVSIPVQPTLEPLTYPAQDSAGTVWEYRGGKSVDVAAMALNPSTPGTIYAATEAGLIKSIDNGESWRIVHQNLPITTVLCVATASTASTNVYIGLASGEIYRSKDGGLQWQRVWRSEMAGEEVVSLLADPVVSGVYYAATNQQLIMTSDSGISWKSLFDIDSILHDSNEPAITTLAAESTLTETVLYVGTNGAGLFRVSPDRTHWESILIEDCTSGDKCKTGNDIRAIAVDPHTPSTLYVGTFFSHVFRSFDSGQSWESIASGLSSPSVGTILIDEAERIVYAGTENGVFRLEAASKVWLPVSLGLITPQIRSLAVDPNNPQMMYAGTTSGAFRTLDAGRSWISLDIGIARNANPTSIALDPANPDRILIGSSDGYILKSQDWGRNWEIVTAQPSPSVVKHIAFDPLTPNMVYAAVDDPAEIWKSYDGGQTWQILSSNCSLGLGRDCEPPAAVDLLFTTDSRLFVATSKGLLRSSDGGKTWKEIALESRVRTLAAHASSPGHMLAGTDTGLFESDDWGSSWKRITFYDGMELDPGEKYPIKAVAITQQAPYTIFVGSNSLLARSDDGGRNWGYASFGDCQEIVPSLELSVAYILANSGTLSKAVCNPPWTNTICDELPIKNCALSGFAVDPHNSERLVFVSEESGVWIGTEQWDTGVVESICSH
jgi:photosystem II stability/assembly factor-like uncharacterized protein